jgi:hypothetical protein
MPRTKDSTLSASQSVISQPQPKPMTSTFTQTEASSHIAKGEKTSMTPMAAIQGARFTLFPKLPPEIRFMIWELAAVPRLIGFKPTKIPAIFRVNKESRIQSKYFFQTRDENTGIIANPKVDILLLDRSSFSEPIYYHSTALHTLSCGGVPFSMTKDIQRVALSVRELQAILVIDCVHCFLRYTLQVRFPALKELILILRPGPAGTTAEDLYEVESGNGHEYLQELIDDTKEAFKMMQKDGRCLGVKLTFMRLETWEDSRRNEQSSG